uniref:Uncharacterized protein n=1 Tax=Siphoviridae sp. ctkV91 TaxID=2827924 RepID=A0A8S5TDF5_9CAUD|nr:MAG TPA: hypothetical protein [Siphoviridae sp. ctkV91]
MCFRIRRIVLCRWRVVLRLCWLMVWTVTRWCTVNGLLVLICWLMVHVLMCIRFLSLYVGLRSLNKLIVFVLM